MKVFGIVVAGPNLKVAPTITVDSEGPVPILRMSAGLEGLPSIE
jgi:hypothetical protein